MTSVRLPLCLAVFGCATGCAHPKTTDPEALEATATVSEVIPTIVTVTWTTPEPTFGHVAYGLTEDLELQTPAETEASTDHSVVVYGLKAGETYDLRAVAADADGSTAESDTLTVTLDPPPSDLTRLTVSEYDEDAAAEGGFVLTTMIKPDGSWIVIVDRDGDYVWYLEVQTGLASTGARFGTVDHSISYLQVDPVGSTDQGEVVQVAMDGTWTTGTRAVMGHHDENVLPDGTVSWLSYDFTSAEIEGEPLPIAADVILELPEGGTDEDEPRTVFATLDHVTPYVMCDHFWEQVYGTGVYDFTHGNSLVYNAAQDAYWLESRNLDAIFVVDRTTGDLRYEIGGQDADIRTEDQSDMWSHGHMSHVWDGGFMLFDNGFHYDPMSSRIVEYAIDEDSGTLELVWQWNDPDREFNPVLGDAQKLGDTYFTSWGPFGTLTEVAQDGTVVWRAEAEIGTALGRAIWADDLYDLSDVWTF